MRIHLYQEEITDEVSFVETVTETGRKYIGVRFWLKSHEDLHHTHDDDDRSAVTFWLGTRELAFLYLAKAMDTLKSQIEKEK